MQGVLATQILRGSLVLLVRSRGKGPLAHAVGMLGQSRSAHGEAEIAIQLRGQAEQLLGSMNSKVRIEEMETKIASFSSCETNSCIGKHGIWVREAVGVALPLAGSLGAVL